MRGSAAKGIFFVSLSIIGIVLVLAVYQVPQPWRGVLVGWLLFVASAGTLVLRLLRHHYEYRSLKLKEQESGQGRRRRASADRRTGKGNGRSRSKRPESLRVVTIDSGGGRYTVR